MMLFLLGFCFVFFLFLFKFCTTSLHCLFSVDLWFNTISSMTNSFFPKSCCCTCRLPILKLPMTLNSKKMDDSHCNAYITQLDTVHRGIPALAGMRLLPKTTGLTYHPLLGNPEIFHWFLILYRSCFIPSFLLPHSFPHMHLSQSKLRLSIHNEGFKSSMLVCIKGTRCTSMLSQWPLQTPKVVMRIYHLVRWH